MDYKKVRIKHLESHIENLSVLLSKWEMKKRIAENPSEIERCEIKIRDMKMNLSQYQIEMEDLQLFEKAQIVEGEITDYKYDAFVSFAKQDKYSIAIPLVKSLQLKGKKIWCSAIELQVGDSIAEEINKAIALSEFAIIIFSPFYFKTWPINEMIAFFAKYTAGDQNLILPIWHNLAYKQIREKAPLIADKLAIRSTIGIDNMAANLIQAMDKHRGLRN